MIRKKKLLVSYSLSFNTLGRSPEAINGCYGNSWHLNKISINVSPQNKLYAKDLYMLNEEKY